MLPMVDPKKFNKLIELYTLINSNYTDLNALLTQIIESAMQLSGADAGSLMIADKEKQELYFEVALGSKGHDVKKIHRKNGGGDSGLGGEAQQAHCYQ